MTRSGRAYLVGLGLAGTLLLVPVGGGVVSAQPVTTDEVPTTAAPVTTAAPPTTQAPPPTTAAPPTTARAVTTASTALVTTTRPIVPTTTVAPASAANETWFTVLLIVLAMAAVAAAVAAIIGLVKGRNRSKANWEGEVRSALVDIDLTVPLVATHAETPDPRPFSQVVTPRLQLLRGRLETVATKAPSDRLRQEVGAVAAGVQSFGFAAEAEWMLRKGAVPPTAEQLGQAGAAAFERRAALEHSMTILRTDIGDPTATGTAYPPPSGYPPPSAGV
jgi:hypothetical protein